MADLLNYKTLAISSLASSYTAADGSFTVASGEGARFSAPSGGSFSYVMVRRGTTGYSYNLFKCTARSSDTFTATGGEDGTTDINLQAGDEVREVICAAGLDQLRADMNQYGTYANLPATCTKGDRYMTSDSDYSFLATATNTWTAFWRGRKVVIPPTSWSIDNVTGGAVATIFGMQTMACGTSSANHVQVAYVNAPGGSYIVKAAFLHQIQVNLSGYGLFFRDGTGKLIACYKLVNGSDYVTAVGKWTTSTSLSADYVTVGGAGGNADKVFMQPAWLAIRDDTTNLKFYESLDGLGVPGTSGNWALLTSQLRGDWLASGPTQIGWGGLDNNGPTVNLISWEII